MTCVKVYLAILTLCGLAIAAPTPQLKMDCTTYRGVYHKRHIMNAMSLAQKEKASFCHYMDLYTAAYNKGDVKKSDIPAMKNGFLHCEQVKKPQQNTNDTDNLIFAVCESYRLVGQTFLHKVGMNINLRTTTYGLRLHNN